MFQKPTPVRNQGADMTHYPAFPHAIPTSGRGLKQNMLTELKFPHKNIIIIIIISSSSSSSSGSSSSGRGSGRSYVVAVAVVMEVAVVVVAAAVWGSEVYHPRTEHVPASVKICGRFGSIFSYRP